MLQLIWAGKIFNNLPPKLAEFPTGRFSNTCVTLPKQILTGLCLLNCCLFLKNRKKNDKINTTMRKVEIYTSENPEIGNEQEQKNIKGKSKSNVVEYRCQENWNTEVIVQEDLAGVHVKELLRLECRGSA